MTPETFIAESPTWPEAVTAIGVFLLVGAVLVVAIWQGMVTWRAHMTGPSSRRDRISVGEGGDDERRS